MKVTHHCGFRAYNTQKNQDNDHSSLSWSSRPHNKRKNHDDECGLLSWFKTLQHKKRLG
jgi:hypothetical protein